MTNPIYETKCKELYDYIMTHLQPGFYFSPDNLSYGIVVKNKYVCIFVNFISNEEYTFDVTVDNWDMQDRSFSQNIWWESYETPNEAMAKMLEMVGKVIYEDFT